MSSRYQVAFQGQSMWRIVDRSKSGTAAVVGFAASYSSAVQKAQELDFANRIQLEMCRAGF